MSIALAKILAKRPVGDPHGKEWVGLSAVPTESFAFGSDGYRDGARLVVPPVSDGGLALRLGQTLVARSDRFWEAGMASVWQVMACQEDSEYVPGVGVFLDPHPPCQLCEPCAAGHHELCVESGRRRWEPGWLGCDMVVPPWTVHRGILDLPPTASLRACLFLDALARIRHRLAPVLKTKPRRVLVLGTDLIGVLAGLVLERLLPDSQREWFDVREGSTLAGERWGYHRTRQDGFESTQADLVIVTDGTGSQVEMAMRNVAIGGAIVFLAPPEPGVESFDLTMFWKRGLSIQGTVGCSGQDRRVVAHWLPDLSDRLLEIEVANLPFEQASSAREILDSRPEILGVVLVNQLEPEA